MQVINYYSFIYKIFTRKLQQASAEFKLPSAHIACQICYTKIYVFYRALRCKNNSKRNARKFMIKNVYWHLDSIGCTCLNIIVFFIELACIKKSIRKIQMHEVKYLKTSTDSGASLIFNASCQL